MNRDWKEDCIAFCMPAPSIQQAKTRREPVEGNLQIDDIATNVANANDGDVASSISEALGHT